jgi:hypothetical protein
LSDSDSFLENEVESDEERKSFGQGVSLTAAPGSIFVLPNGPIALEIACA